MSYYRTTEHRALRAQLIRRWKPWESSTGPKTEEGKAKVSQNAYKGSERELLRELGRELKRADEVIQCLEDAGTMNF